MSSFLRAAIKKARAIENLKENVPSISMPPVTVISKPKAAKKQMQPKKPKEPRKKGTSSIFRQPDKSAKSQTSNSKKSSKLKRGKIEGSVTLNYNPETGESMGELSESDMSDYEGSDEEEETSHKEDQENDKNILDDDIVEEDHSDEEKDTEEDKKKTTKNEEVKNTKPRKVKQPYTEELLAREIFVGNITIHASPLDVLRACDIPKRNIENMRFRSLPVVTETKKKYEIFQKLGQQEFVGRTKNAYIRFKDKDVMHAYLQGVRNRENPIELANLPLRINWAGNAEKFSVFDKKRTVFITNLHHRVGEKDLTLLGQMVGKVEATRVLRDEQTFRSRRMGFIMFSSRDLRAKAFKVLETKKLYGRQFYLHPALDKPEAQAAVKKYRKTHPKPPPRVSRLGKISKGK
eukprot:GHVP01013407.1.p2 GENE.GHVP01013407.1~~GHVP01013407.1.p2  ORF type:complete len:405 (+),score=87.33 GHVP01013407.1:2164-3378(+)